MHEDRLVAGKYRIEALLARGSMGEVYEAVHVGIGKRVALKAMPRELVSSEEASARFRREVRAAGMLDSDYIVQVFDAGRDDELGPYLVTELLVGEDLEIRLGREGPLDPATTAAVGYEVARGLAKAHAAGVLHRDLKPGNVFLAERDDGVRVAKILDFGVSKTAPAAATDDDSCVTAVGVTLGTPEYMSPEQAQGVADLDGRSDVWSLAATLYEALCGHPPHVCTGSAMDVMMRIVEEDAPPLAAAAAWVPPALAQVIHAGLERDRNERIPDAASFARALELAVPEARWSLSGVHPVPPAAQRKAFTPVPPASPRRHPDADGDAPPSSRGGVRFFRRDALGLKPLAEARGAHR